MIHTEKFVFGLAFDGVSPTGVMKSALCSVEERLLSPPPPKRGGWRSGESPCVWRVGTCRPPGKGLGGKAVASGQ